MVASRTKNHISDENYMQKEKFITVMAILDDATQCRLESVHNEWCFAYGEDSHTRLTPFHITLGSYAPEDTDKIVARIIAVCKETKQIPVRFSGLNHFGNVVYFLEPEISEELFNLHLHFDSDYANGYPGWMPHVTLYRHQKPTEITGNTQILAQIQDAKIVGIELGEFFPAKKILRVLFEGYGETNDENN